MYSIEAIDNNYFWLLGDTNAIADRFRYQEDERIYNYKTKKLEFARRDKYLYKMRTKRGAKFDAGFAAFIYYHLSSELDDNSKDLLMTRYISASKLNHKFEGLRGTQEEDLNSLLRFKRGLFSVYTGYGKTQLIAVLVDYLLNNTDDKVLIITPNQKALDELKTRIGKVSGVSTKYFDPDSQLNIININGFLRSGSYDKSIAYWKEVKWLIADECEYCLTDSAYEMMDLLTNVERSYGFSGTADKLRAKSIRMREGMTDVVTRNKSLIAKFGFSSVYRIPSGFNIEVCNVRTSMFRNSVDLRLDENTIYSEIIVSIFTDGRFCEGLRKIAYAEKGGLYIPMRSLEVIDHWIKNVFTWEDVNVATITGAGYSIYNSGKLVKNTSLDELKEMVKSGYVEIITGTSSSYRAIDLPELNTIIPLTSQLASNVLQQVGRVARSKNFKIINLTPDCYISCYTSDLRKRKTMISEYYNDSLISYFNKTDLDYGIY